MKNKTLASELSAAKGKSLVLCDSNDKAVQIMVNAINDMLNNYGSIIDVSKPSYLKAGDDKSVARLIQDMNDGKVGALIISGVNPSYT